MILRNISPHKYLPIQISSYTNISPLVRRVTLFVCCCGRWHLNISKIACSCPQLPTPLTFAIISFSISEFPFSWYMLLRCMQLHFWIYLKTNDICLFVIAGDDISIYHILYKTPQSPTFSIISLPIFDVPFYWYCYFNAMALSNTFEDQ